MATRCYVEFCVKNYGKAEASATKPKFWLACILQRSRVTNSGAQTTPAADPLAPDKPNLKNVWRCCPAAPLHAFNTACGCSLGSLVVGRATVPAAAIELLFAIAGGGT